MNNPLFRILSLLLCVFASIHLGSPTAQASPPVRAAMVINATTGKILYQLNPDSPIPPASLTKVMTSMLAHDAIRRGNVSYSTMVRVPRAAATAGGSSMRLRSGERISVRGLLEGMIVASGNDAATTLATLLGQGSLPRFVDRMNERAQSLGMSSTVYRNPSGLPASGQMTTARDMARLAMSYIRIHPEAMRIHSLSWAQYGRHRVTTTNPFLGVPGVDGLKTGFTVNSGYNIIVTAKSGANRIVVVVLGGRSRARRDVMAGALIDAACKFPSSPSAVKSAGDRHSFSPRYRKLGSSKRNGKKNSRSPRRRSHR